MGKWIHPTLALSDEQKAVPFALQKLDAHQTASHCGITTRDLFAMRGSGRVGNKFFQFDATEKDWKLRNFCYRADIPQLKAEIAKGQPGPVTQVVTAPRYLSLKQIADELGVNLMVVRNMRNHKQRNQWPDVLYKRGKGPEWLYHEKVIPELKLIRLRMRVATELTTEPTKDIPMNTEWYDIQQIAQQVGYPDYSVYNLITSVNHKAKFTHFATRRVGKKRLYESAVVNTVRKLFAENPNYGQRRQFYKRHGEAVKPVNHRFLQGIFKATELPKEATQKAMQVVHVDIAAELIKEGHVEAGIYLIKKYA